MPRKCRVAPLHNAVYSSWIVPETSPDSTSVPPAPLSVKRPWGIAARPVPDHDVQFAVRVPLREGHHSKSGQLTVKLVVTGAPLNVRSALVDTRALPAQTRGSAADVGCTKASALAATTTARTMRRWRFMVPFGARPPAGAFGEVVQAPRGARVGRWLSLGAASSPRRQQTNSAVDRHVRATAFVPLPYNRPRGAPSG